MKLNSAKEMLLVIILSLLVVITSATRLIVSSFGILDAVWLIVDVIFVGIIIVFYSVKLKFGIFLMFVILFSFESIYHIIAAPNNLTGFTGTELLRNITDLLYLLAAVTLFFGYIFFLASTTLEIKAPYSLCSISLIISSGLCIATFVLSLLSANAGQLEWDAAFRYGTQMFLFMLLWVISSGENIKDRFLFFVDKSKLSQIEKK